MDASFRLWLGAALTVCSVSYSGSVDVIRFGPSHSKGLLPIAAAVENTVSLRIEDSPALGGNLASAQGINFGVVNNHGTTTEPGVKGWAKGSTGHYEAEFLFTASRSGAGHVTLHVTRSVAGNFSAKDGIEIDDAFGVLRPLAAGGATAINVLNQQPPGTYEKTLAINIYPTDTGNLKTVLQFTLCAL